MDNQKILKHLDDIWTFGHEPTDEEREAVRAAMDIVEKHSKIGGWIPCSELPDNAKHKGAFCPKYRVKTKYGETIGWYNPAFKSWFILVWFMTERFLEEEIDFEKGDVPKVVRCSMELEIVTAWREPLEAHHE